MHILKGKKMSIPLAVLLMERLAMELSYPGSIRGMLEGKTVSSGIPKVIFLINKARIEAAKAA